MDRSPPLDEGLVRGHIDGSACARLPPTDTRSDRSPGRAWARR